MIENYFVCIGAQKSGTTWLARVLAGHPDIFVTPVKEIHYFDHVRGVTQHLSDAKRWSRRRKYFQRLATQWGRFGELKSQWTWYQDYRKSPLDDAWYAQLFSHRGSRRIAGEVTPEYAILGREGLEHIRRLAPKARVLFIMRNPVTRAWSQVLHHCRANGRDATRLSAADVEALIAEPKFHAFCDYERTLADMEAVFAPEQRHVMFYEDMHADREKALREVCGFIGVEFAAGRFRELGKRFNRSESIALPEAVRPLLRERYRGQAVAVSKRIGRVPESWRKEFDLPPAPAKDPVSSGMRAKRGR